MNMISRISRSIGPAIVVAAVVLGPGSILTSSKAGASYGYAALPVIGISAILMMAMVALAARIGVIYDDSPCDQLTRRLHRGVSIAIGLILFLLVALFQSSNNLAIIAGIEPLLDAQAPLKVGWKIGVLITANAFVIICLVLLRNLYSRIEAVMKVLIGLMVLAFTVNFIATFATAVELPARTAVAEDSPRDFLALLGLVGTTFSVGGAFYQAYLVKEKGWTLADAKRGMIDSILGIGVLGIITAIILCTSVRTFYGTGVSFANVGDIALQLEPLFGSGATIIFCVGIFAGALSSFMVNAMIGGTVMSDSLGLGSQLNQRGPLLFTVLALLVGMTVGIVGILQQGSTAELIIFAQALTVLGIPALAAALIFLGTRKELAGDRKIPRWILILATIGFILSCVLAFRTVDSVKTKIANLQEVAAIRP